MLPLDGDPAPFFTSEFNETFATFSPDGQWLAYVSNQNGYDGVYVRPYPGPEPATPISDGGASPVWSLDGRQIYYVQAGVLWAVDVIRGEELQPGRPAPHIDPWTGGTAPVRDYDVFADDSFVKRVLDDDGRSDLERFGATELQVIDLERFGATELQVILNWTEELKARVPN